MRRNRKYTYKTTMKKILILNGPNLNLQGTRDVKVYGSTTFDDCIASLRERYEGRAEFDYFQSNIEGELIDAVHASVGRYDGIVFNAGAIPTPRSRCATPFRPWRLPWWRCTYRRFSHARSFAIRRCWLPWPKVR